MNENQEKRREVLTIEETVKRAKEEGLPISGYNVRRAIKTGKIPCRVLGRTYLIYWPNLIKWITCEDGQDVPPLPKPEPKPVLYKAVKLPVAGGIRRQY